MPQFLSHAEQVATYGDHGWTLGSTGWKAARGAGGWDGPVEILLPGDRRYGNYKHDYFTLAALIADSMPGHWQKGPDHLKTAASAAHKSGHAIPGGFEMTIDHPGAALQEFGGDVAERWAGAYPNPGVKQPRTLQQQYHSAGGGAAAGRYMQVMHWVEGGVDHYARHAAGFTVQAVGFVVKGFDRWVNARGHEGLEIGWAPAGGGG